MIFPWLLPGYNPLCVYLGGRKFCASISLARRLPVIAGTSVPHLLFYAAFYLPRRRTPAVSISSILAFGIQRECPPRLLSFRYGITIARSLPTSALSSMDLPAFGLPRLHFNVSGAILAGCVSAAARTILSISSRCPARGAR